MIRGAASGFRDFLATEAAGGIVLMIAAALALIAANVLATAHGYEALLHLVTGPVLSPALGPMTVHLWINDGAMAVFFLLVGLEIKREFVGGALATWEARRLPIVPAVAGMVVPAAVYLAVTWGDPALSAGWAIPAATDIAFAIGVMALLGKRVPVSLKLFLTTVAIVDDMGAVAIIALAYTEHIAWWALAGAAGVVLLVYTGNRWIGQATWPYIVIFVGLWWLVLLSGVHATIAGVVAAMLVPAGPAQRLEHALHPWVAFLVVPLFGFANAGVSLGEASLGEPLVLGIALGLFVGKQAGIFGGVVLAEKLGIAPAPEESRMQLYGISLLAGIGFTMSLFIGGLAFPGNAALADTVRIGVLGGSLLSAVAGFLVLRLASSR